MLPQRIARQPCCERFSCNSTTAACRSLCQLSCFSLTNFYDSWPPSRRVRPALRPPASMKARKTRAKRPVSVVCSIIIEVYRQTLSQRLAGVIWPCALQSMPCRVTVRIVPRSLQLVAAVSILGDRDVFFSHMPLGRRLCIQRVGRRSDFRMKMRSRQES
jgi:hypothetical protein